LHIVVYLDIYRWKMFRIDRLRRAERNETDSDIQSSCHSYYSSQTI